MTLSMTMNWRALLVCTALSTLAFSTLAGGTHTDGHDESKKMPMDGGHKESEEGKGHGGPGHSHDNWMTPPAKYASLRYDGWDDIASARRGKVIYRKQCVACHGPEGRGDGPAAAGLEHPPANLTNNFHRLGGKGDGYLFWRVTEGGTVEPFKSLKSAMPNFGHMLTEQQRWDVLTYVHQVFHHGFKDQVDKDADDQHQHS